MAQTEPSETAGSGGAPQPNGVGSKKNGSGAKAGASSTVVDPPPVLSESAGAAGSDSSDSEPKPPLSCDINATCSATCEQKTVTCGVEPSFTCEFSGFNGATAEVACGQRVVIGTACCGGCGCVPVEVYFDGKYCWQGIPQCTLGPLIDQFFNPRLPTTPNPSFTPPDYFYLGTGGVPGAAASAGNGGSGDAGSANDAGGVGADGGSSAAGRAGNSGNAGSVDNAGRAGGPASAGTAGFAGDAAGGTAGNRSGAGAGESGAGGESGSAAEGTVR
ncbi:MAG TPA: hypothetical protein VER12_06385 [Polyangiaceae bacterium]|nr:hypothetical protein [Polyangiaceae bacterium]